VKLYLSASNVVPRVKKRYYFFVSFRFVSEKYLFPRQTNCMTRMISRDYHIRYHSAYYIVYHRFLPKTYTKLFSINGFCFCCCCFQCNFPYLIVCIRAWFAGSFRFSVSVPTKINIVPLYVSCLYV
jgi:hypothetical protein